MIPASYRVVQLQFPKAQLLMSPKPITDALREVLECWSNSLQQLADLVFVVGGPSHHDLQGQAPLDRERQLAL